MLRMQVVADIDETFLPLPDDLLVNLEGSRAVVEALLDSLPQMFAGNHTVSSRSLSSNTCRSQFPHPPCQACRKIFSPECPRRLRKTARLPCILVV